MSVLKVKKGYVTQKGTTLRPGSLFDGDPEDFAHLIPEYIEVVEGESGSGEPINLEAFGDLKANEQKDLLSKAGVEPSGNKEGRVEQYRELIGG